MHKAVEFRGDCCSLVYSIVCATRLDGWRGCSRLIRLECTQWMTTQTLMMSVGLGPKSANEDLNVNETSILPAQRLRFSRIFTPRKIRLVRGRLLTRTRCLRASMLSLEPETHGVRENSRTSSASECIIEQTSIRKPCMTGDDIATARCTVAIATMRLRWCGHLHRERLELVKAGRIRSERPDSANCWR